jgi:hypothetical protein
MSKRVAQRRYWEGMKLGDKIVKEVFRNMAKTEYFITFTDGTYQIFKY